MLQNRFTIIFDLRLVVFQTTSAAQNPVAALYNHIEHAALSLSSGRFPLRLRGPGLSIVDYSFQFHVRGGYRLDRGQNIVCKGGIYAEAQPRPIYCTRARIVFGYETKHEMWRRQQCKKCKCGPVNVLCFHPKINTCIIHQHRLNPGGRINMGILILKVFLESRMNSISFFFFC